MRRTETSSPAAGAAASQRRVRGLAYVHEAQLLHDGGPSSLVPGKHAAHQSLMWDMCLGS